MTSQARAWRDVLRGWGPAWRGEVFAAHIDPRIAKEVRPLKDLAGRVGPDDTLLVHYSAYAPRLRRVLEMPQRTVLLSHNVTPARWFWDYEPTIAVHCALGRKQLPEYAAKADVVAGVSAYNARELGSDRVVPILFDHRALGAPAPAAAPPGPPTLLFVGRLAPHKRQDQLIRLLALLRRNRLPDARLVLVGEPLNPNYGARLRELADALAPGAVDILSGLSSEDLAARYREAHAFVCLSEHEGFCIPVLEALHFGVPVVTHAVGGIPEVAGDAAILLDATDAHDLAVVAEAVAAVVEDGVLRAELRARGAARQAVFEPERTQAAMRDLLTLP